jgi:hypothetical protein
LRRFRGSVGAGLACALASTALVAGVAQAQETVTISPTSPDVGNCFPFGIGDGPPGQDWTPFTGFIYRNLPPFELRPGDALAFDLGAPNDFDIELEIALAATTQNGGIENAGAFTTVVSNTQTPANPRGDTVIGNFELQFASEAAFDFPGGGLIIRFSNPSADYAADGDCDQVLVRATSSDPSGFFLQRFIRDADGAFPWSGGSTSDIGGFQVTPHRPDTTITRGPKDKTKRKKATFEFTGTDTRAVSGFECSVDGGAFAACTSPFKVKVPKGKHNFQVRAVDEHGNADATPASDDWKRKKKRKK